MGDATPELRMAVPHVHSYETLTVRPATCTQKGLADGWYCSGCRQYFAVKGTRVIGSEERWIPILEHTPGTAVKEKETSGDCQTKASWESVVYCSICKTHEISRETVYGNYGGHIPVTDGIAGGSHCGVCGEILTPPQELPPPEHDWSPWEVRIGANCFSSGLEVRICSSCAAEETREIPAGSGSCPAGYFQDVDPNGWYHEAVDFTLSHGLMNGISANLFDTQGQFTRAQMATVLYRMAGSPEVSGREPFDDVQPGDWFYKAVLWGYQNEAVNGMGPTAFAPSVPVSREQMAALLQRFAMYQGRYVEASAQLSRFADAAAVSDWAVPSLEWAVACGLFQGNTHNCLDPQNSATRAEAATLLMRFARAFVQA